MVRIRLLVSMGRPAPAKDVNRFATNLSALVLQVLLAKISCAIAQTLKLKKIVKTMLTVSMV